MEMQADEVGPSLRYATAKVTKAQRGSGGGGGWGGGQQGQGAQQGGQAGQQYGDQQGGQQPAPAQGGQGQASQSETDPWATGGNAGGQQGGGWNNSPSYDEPPF